MVIYAITIGHFCTCQSIRSAHGLVYRVILCQSFITKINAVMVIKIKENKYKTFYRVSMTCHFETTINTKAQVTFASTFKRVMQMHRSTAYAQKFWQQHGKVKSIKVLKVSNAWCQSFCEVSAELLDIYQPGVATHKFVLKT